MGCKNTTAALPLCSPSGTLARPAGTLLLPGFATAASHLVANFGVVGAQVCIRHLANEGLVHKINIYRGSKDHFR